MLYFIYSYIKYLLYSLCCTIYICNLLLLLFSHPVVFNFLWLHGLLHASPPCPSSPPGLCPSSCSMHRWCHPAISSSDALFSFYPQSFPASGTFPLSCLYTSDDQNNWSFSFSISPSSECSGLISLKINWFDLVVQGTLLESLLQHHGLKASIL